MAVGFQIFLSIAKGIAGPSRSIEWKPTLAWIAQPAPLGDVLASN